MYIRELTINRMKRLRDFHLTFPGPVKLPRGKERMPWTVLIGENGTCKTAILQAIALTAAGNAQVSGLAGKTVGHLVDRRAELTDWMSVRAEFFFSKDAEKAGKAFFPSKTDPLVASPDLRLISNVDLWPGSDTIFGSAVFENDGDQNIKTSNWDPLDMARSVRLPHWFVAAYGTARVLSDSAFKPYGISPIDRLRPLFDPQLQLTGTAFANYFADDPAITRRFAKALHRVLFPKHGPLLPELTDLTLSGKGGVRNAVDLLDRHRFKQRFGSTEVGIPTVALAFGYQSTIAWIADLIGHILLETDEAIEPAEMCGLVLVDEIDLYVHPTLQVSLIRSLQQTFPLLQFVVTTHSPLILAAMRPDQDEIVRLEVDPGTGDVQRRNMTAPGQAHEPDARLMTTAGIYQTWFGLPDVFGGPEGKMLADFQSIASNPYRTDVDHERMVDLEKGLRAAGVDPTYEPTQRKQRVRDP